MLTIEDIRNPARKSGFDHVGTAMGRNNKIPIWRAEGNRKTKEEQALGGAVYKFRGPSRRLPEEAAQDYCDYMNGNRMLTVEDLRNPSRKSGFDHVNGDGGGTGVRANRPTIWRAEVYDASRSTLKSGKAWNGPYRKTPEEAAQDYCDYANSGKATTPTALNFAGHGSLRESIERDEEVEAALGVLRDHKAQKAGRQGYVYLIGVEGDDTGVKLGYSVKPEARVGELQTGNPRKLVLLGYFPGTTADEKRIHAKYINYNLIGEWFTPTQAMFEEFGLGSEDSYTTTEEMEYA